MKAMQNQTVQNLEDYTARKEAMLKEAFDLKFQGMRFTEHDHKANQVFHDITKNFKSRIDNSFHFRPMHYRDLVESSSLHKLLFDMPKGSQHHSHNPCSIPSSWFVNHSMVPNMYIDEKGVMESFDKAPEDPKWKSVLKLRDEATNKEEFDKKFEENFYMIIGDSSSAPGDKKASFMEGFNTTPIWDEFEFKINNRNVVVYQNAEKWEQYMLDVFLEAIEEGYSNFQMRNLIPFGHHELFMDPEEEITRYRRALAKAQEKDPNFSIGITFTVLRFWDLAQVQSTMDTVNELVKKHRDIIVGFDIVGEEDARAWRDFADMFIQNKKKGDKEGFDLPLLLHCGETLKKTNDNLYDATILETKRIGHGFNLAKHPYLMSKIKEKDICIEVNPISNQVLEYAADLRLHPAIMYHNFGLKISISSDDNGIFDLSTIWDWFVVAICFEFDLLDLKRVITNSIETSCMVEDINENMRKSWESRWEEFVAKIVEGKYN